MQLDLYMRSLIASIAFIGLFTQPVVAMQCSSFLQASNGGKYYIELPGKGNQFTKKDFDSLSDNKQKLVVSLNQAFEALEAPEVIEQIVLLNQPFKNGILEIPEQESPLFFKEELKNKAYEKTALENYNFLKTYLKATLPDSTLAGLSMLYKNIRRSENQEPIVSNHKYNIAYKSIMLKFAKVINQKRYAKAVLEFIGNEEVKEKLSDLLLNKNRHNFDESVDVEKTLAGIEKGLSVEISVFEKSYALNNKFSKKHIDALGLRFFNIMNYLKVDFEDAVKQNKEHEGIQERRFEEVSRDLRLELIEIVILEIFGEMKNLRSLVLFIDHSLTGHPLPLEGKEHERLILEGLNSSLTSVRTEISQKRLERREKTKVHNENRVQTRIFKKESLLFVRPEPNYKERRNPNKRKNQRNKDKTQDNTDKNKAEERRQNETSEVISDDLNLLHFSEISKTPVNFESLKANKTYQVRFLRDDADSPIQEVVFGASVVKELNSDQDLTKQFMRALNLGHAIRTHQDGLKILKATDLHGRLYELKLRKSDHRLILSHNDGNWRVLKLTDKKNFDRTVNSLGKFYRRNNN